MDIKKAETQARFEKMLRASEVWQDKYAAIMDSLFIYFGATHNQVGHYGFKHVREFDQGDFDEFIRTRGDQEELEKYYQARTREKPLVEPSLSTKIVEGDGRLWSGYSKKQYNQVFKIYEQGFATAFTALGIRNYAQKKKLFDALVWEYVLQTDEYPFDLSVEDWQQYAKHELSGASSIEYRETPPDVHKNIVRLPLDDIRKHYEFSDFDYDAILEDMALQHRMQKEDEWTDYQEYFRRSVKKLHIKLIPID